MYNYICVANWCVPLYDLVYNCVCCKFVSISLYNLVYLCICTTGVSISLCICIATLCVFVLTVMAGMSAGGLGALVGTPTEVVLIRMTADGRLPVEQRRNYKHVVDALFRIVREEGITTLWSMCEL